MYFLTRSLKLNSALFILNSTFKIRKQDIQVLPSKMNGVKIIKINQLGKENIQSMRHMDLFPISGDFVEDIMSGISNNLAINSVLSEAGSLSLIEQYELLYSKRRLFA